MTTLRQLRATVASKATTWDELTTFIRMVVHGYCNYAPLVGIPRPHDLHEEDGEWAAVLKLSAGMRRTVSTAGLAAHRHNGGLQWCGVVPGLVAAVQRELMVLMLGDTPAAHITR